jgi:DNA-binding response OmpR family regulator
MSDSEIVRGENALNCAVVSREPKLLLADDDPSVRDLISRILSFLGYEVMVANNGLEAGTLFLTGSYDLVITDLHMPLMNGWQLSRLIKERSPSTPVIVITGFRDDRYWEEMNMNWVDAIVMKPFKVKEFGRTIQSLLRVA